MEMLRLILNIISSVVMFFFGATMIWAGVYNIKKHIEPKRFSIMAIAAGICDIVLVIMSFVW